MGANCPEERASFAVGPIVNGICSCAEYSVKGYLMSSSTAISRGMNPSSDGALHFYLSPLVGMRILRRSKNLSLRKGETGSGILYGR